ncbi:MAG: DUF1656 domain-containing protein [Deltaproteobacteria bacterium]|jgi:hypothetical protein|nr:DUF1656 domain-containing protein [Deltaproteobacteria bacterium]MBW2520537.1 DUF1656 domain-containing protein [Deltaproteobacteria bacterium]
MIPTPHELNIGGIYLPPLLVAALLGVILTVFTVLVLNRYRISRYFYKPELVFIALLVIYTILIGTFVVRI